MATQVPGGPRPRVSWKSLGRGAGLTRLTDAAPERWVPSALTRQRSVTLASPLHRWHGRATEGSGGSDLKLESPGAACFFHGVLDSPPYRDCEPRPQLLESVGGEVRQCAGAQGTRGVRKVLVASCTRSGRGSLAPK